MQRNDMYTFCLVVYETQVYEGLRCIALYAQAE